MPLSLHKSSRCILHAINYFKLFLLVVTNYSLLLKVCLKNNIFSRTSHKNWSKNHSKWTNSWPLLICWLLLLICFLSLLPHKSYHYFSRNSLSDWKPLINFVLSLCGNTAELTESVLHSGCIQEISVLHQESRTHPMATVSHLLKGDLP